MKRLTFDGNFCDIAQCVGEYPENAETRLLTWFESHYGFPVGELMGLLEAKQEGRVAVLPFRIGTHVRGKNGNWCGVVEEIEFNSDGFTLFIRSGGGSFYVRPDEVVATSPKV